METEVLLRVTDTSNSYSCYEVLVNNGGGELVQINGGGRGNLVELSITSKGRKQFEKLTPAWKAAQCAVVKTLGEKRWSAILSDLETAVSALKI